MVVRRCVIPRSGSARAACEHLVEVQHRLAHAHEDAVVDRLDPAEVERLVEDLRGGQVPAELHLRRSRRRCTSAGSRTATRRRSTGGRRGSASAPPRPTCRRRCGRASSRCRRATPPRARPRASRRERARRARRAARPGRSSSRRSPARRRPPSPRPGGPGRRARRARRGRSSGARDPPIHGSAGGHALRDSPLAAGSIG